MIQEADFKQLKSKKISKEQVDKQLQQFSTGFDFMDIQKPASISDGILLLSEEQKLEFTDIYRSYIDQEHTVTKFVPASGAASRMFKALFAFIDASPKEQEEQKKEGIINTFLTNINKFAFAEELQNITKINFSDNQAVFDNSVEIISKLLNKDGLNYGNNPKGVLSFHKENDKIFTPIEEHIKEGALYGQNYDGSVNIHFTVSEEHTDLFKNIVKDKISLYEAEYGTNFNISYSTQKSHTDTIAVNPDNTPFRTEDGKLLFRPGGHGALIENLNEIDSDIIFIKNIDNVTTEKRLKDTIQYKEALAGVLCHYQEKIFDFLNKLDNNKVPESEINNIIDFIETELFIIVPEKVKSSSTNDKKEFIKNKLNRPIRVCGMVKNEGEPGGGPFWGIGKYGETSLQVVEGSQIDMNNPEKVDLVKKSTHFNPVDLICATKNYKGQKFNLPDFTDPATGFISSKSMNGRELKALELPGLWNGAMSDWTTIFVEVPISTFNPVKIVNDLLRDTHQ